MAHYSADNVAFDYNHSSRNHQVEFKELPPKVHRNERENSSKNNTRIVLLVFLAFFLAGAATLAAVSTAMVPWWIQNGGATNYEWLRIGLWKACIKEKVDGEWKCNDYNGGRSASPFDHIELLQNCMIAAASVSGLCFIFTLIAIVLRKSSIFKAFVAIIMCLSLASAILYGISIGYASDEKDATDLVPKWAFVDQKLIKHAIMFYLACAGAGCAFVAVVISTVFMFITDDLEEWSDEEKEKRRQGFYRDRPSSWNDGYDKSYDFEREISNRGRNVIKKHRHPFDYAVHDPYETPERQSYQEYQDTQNERRVPLEDYNHRESARRVHSEQSRHHDVRRVHSEESRHHQQTPNERRVPLEDFHHKQDVRRVHSEESRRHQPSERSYDKVVVKGRTSSEENYRGNRRSFSSNKPDYPDQPYNYAGDTKQSYQSYQPALIGGRSVLPPRGEPATSLPDYSFQPPRRYEHEPQQPKLVSVQQRPNSAPIEYRQPSKKERQMSTKNHSLEEQTNQADYQMYFNTPY